jgi:hypothetical protein
MFFKAWPVLAFGRVQPEEPACQLNGNMALLTLVDKHGWLLLVDRGL